MREFHSINTTHNDFFTRRIRFYFYFGVIDGVKYILCITIPQNLS
jgi:hypothetical protein